MSADSTLFVVDEPSLQSQAPTERWTERRVLNALRARHAKRGGNGPEWVFMEHVRNGAGFMGYGEAAPTNTIDALAMHMWPSKKNALHAYEVKVSRSDWLRELQQPGKAAAWVRHVDYFWVAAPAGIVRAADLPPHWGLVEVLAGDVVDYTRAAVRAKRLAEPTPLGRGLIASMLREAWRSGLSDERCAPELHRYEGAQR